MDNIEFKKLRLDMSLTQSQLALELDLAPNSIARIERGEVPLRKVVSMAMLYLDSTFKASSKLSVMDSPKPSSSNAKINDRSSPDYKEEQLDLPSLGDKSFNDAYTRFATSLGNHASRKPVRSSPRKKKKKR